MNNQEHPNGIKEGLEKPDEGIELKLDETPEPNQIVEDTRIAVSRITWSSGSAVQTREFPREEL